VNYFSTQIKFSSVEVSLLVLLCNQWILRNSLFTEAVGYKTKNKRKSKPKKLIPMSPDNNCTITNQEPTTSPSQAASFRSPSQSKPTQDLNSAQQFHNFYSFKDSPGLLRPTRPTPLYMEFPLSPPADHNNLQDDEGYLQLLRFANTLFEDAQQMVPHSPKPTVHDFESGKLQELQVSPALYDHFNSANHIRIANGNARDERLQGLSYLNDNQQGFYGGENGGFYQRQQRYPISSTSTMMSTVIIRFGI
jgi:hypothetical protein